jgi:hypothetical protein
MPVALRFAAQCALDCRVDKDAIHGGIAGRQFEQFAVLRTPHRGVDVLTAFGDNARCRYLVALDRGQTPIRHRRQPNVALDAKLVRRMPGQHRPAARLRQVTDQEPAPSGRFAGRRQPLQKCN